jgi:hypothetical protein
MRATVARDTRRFGLLRPEIHREAGLLFSDINSAS